MKLRTMRRAVNVARMWIIRNAYATTVRKPEGNNLGDLEVDGRILLKCILKKQSVRVWTGCIWLRLVTSYEVL
jgi:hypothetical protein